MLFDITLFFGSISSSEYSSVRLPAATRLFRFVFSWQMHRKGKGYPQTYFQYNRYTSNNVVQGYTVAAKSLISNSPIFRIWSILASRYFVESPSSFERGDANQKERSEACIY